MRMCHDEKSTRLRRAGRARSPAVGIFPTKRAPLPDRQATVGRLHSRPISWHSAQWEPFPHVWRAMVMGDIMRPLYPSSDSRETPCSVFTNSFRTSRPNLMTSSMEPSGSSCAPVGRIHSLIRSGSFVGRSVLMLPLALVAACGGAERFPQTSLDPRSDLAEAIDRLWNLTLY